MMVRKKILLVTSWVFPHVGGVSSHLQLLVRKLGISDSEVVSFKDIVAVQSRGLRRFETAFLHHSRRFLKLETISLFAKALSEIIEGKDCDIVHCHDAMATWAALRARKRSGRAFKIVSTVHGPVSFHMVEEGYTPDSPDVKKVKQCEKEAWKGCDAIIAVDRGQAEIVRSQGADPEKITIIPNAVDIEKIDIAASSLPIMRKDDRAWIFVPRRLSPKNGIEFIIRALSLIKERPRLLLAGTGLERQRLGELVVQLGLKKDVLFLGVLDHSVMLPLMSASDIVAIPSVPVHGIEEATSIAAIEAMALSKPVIASEIGGLKLLIEDNVNGILVPPGDPDRLAGSIANLLSDIDKRERIGHAARKVVEEKFSVVPWFEKHKVVYSNLLI